MPSRSASCSPGRSPPAGPPTSPTAIAVGFLGAFTTFSTFAYEATALLRDDRPVAAFAYVASSLVIGLAASALGYVLGRAVT